MLLYLRYAPRRTLLPDWRSHPEFFPRPKRKSTFDELHRALDRHFVFNRQQQMEVVRHNDELVQANLFCAR